MAEIQPIKADETPQTKQFTISLLAENDFSILPLGGDFEKIAITVKTVATKVNVFATADFSASPVFSQAGYEIGRAVGTTDILTIFQ